MAGRYVLLEFEDRDEANDFVEKYRRVSTKFTIKGMWLKPRKFCQCSTKQKHTMNNWAKDSKYGLYICRNCRRPSRHHETGVLERLKYVFGFNILPGVK